MDVHQSYQEFLSGLLERVYTLDLKVTVLIRVRSLQSVDAHLSVAPLLLGPIADSLLADTIVSLAKLFEESADRSIPKLLNYTEQNNRKIQWQRGQVSLKQIRAQRDQIAQHDRALKNIKSQRDKHFAHYDKQYFTAPDKLSEDFPVTVSDVVAVLQLAQRILSAHSLALSGIMRVSFGCFAAAHFDRMIEVLRDASTCSPTPEGDSS